VEQIGGCAGDQVVDREDFPTAIEEIVAKVRPEKSCSSRDYSAQRVTLPNLVRSGPLCSFMIPNSLTRSISAGTRNLIVAFAVFSTKSDSANAARICNGPDRMLRNRRGAIDLE